MALTIKKKSCKMSRDHQCYNAPATTEGDFSKSDVHSRANSTTPFAANVIPDDRFQLQQIPALKILHSYVLVTDYASTRETPNRGDSTPE